MITKALGMRAKWLKPEWMWVVRWIYLFGVGCGFLYIAYMLYLLSGNELGFVTGAACGFVGTAGCLLIYFLINYAIRRIRLGRKAKRFYKE